MHKILQSYLHRLTNLSGNNRSLYLPRLIGQQFIDLHDFDFLNNFSSFSLIEWLISRGVARPEGVEAQQMPLCAVQDSRHEASNKVSQAVKKLSRTEKFIEEEQGSRDLYVGWPFVQGKFSDGTLVRCPLMFFPVQLEEREVKNFGLQWVLTLRSEVAVSLNKSFLLAYAHYQQRPFHEALAEYSFDDFDPDSRIFRTALYQLFKDSSVQINFNQELFADKLQAFRKVSKAMLEESEKEGVLKLYPEAVLGIFPQAGSYLVPDYLKLIHHSHIPDIEGFFGKRAASDKRVLNALESLDASFAEQVNRQRLDYASRVKEEQMFTPYAMDAHQEKALKLVKRGNSVVVQGPPGTGKSQLITNLIADYVAHGKRVLLVSQKKAALDVVYARLQQQGVHPFVALVHDFKNDRPAIFRQIGKQIDALYEYQVKNNSLDSILLERNFLQYSRRIEQISEELDEFTFALFDESEAGVSVKELYLTSSLEQPHLNIKQEYQYFKIPDLPPFVSKLKRLTTYAQRYDKETYLLCDRKSFNAYSVEDLKNMRTVFSEVPAFKQKVSGQVSQVLQEEVDYTICEQLQRRSEDIARMIPLIEEPQSYAYFQDMVPLLEKEADPLWLSNIERVAMDCYQGEGPEVSLPTGELGKFQHALQQASEARPGVFQWLWWKWFSKEKAYVQQVFEANQLPLTKKGFHAMQEKIDNRLNLEHNLSKLREYDWIGEVPALETSGNFSKEQLQDWFYHKNKALQAAIVFKSLRNFKEFFHIETITYQQLSQRVKKLLDALHDIPDKQNAWLVYLTPAQVSQLNTPEQSEPYLKALQQDFDALCDFDTLKAYLTSYEKDVFYRLYEHGEEVSEESVASLFQNSVRLAWIDHIEVKYPVLRIVSSLRLHELEEELQRSIEEKLAISREILLMKAREKTYYDVEYNRLNNMVTYRDLSHQISKKRKVWPLRKLITAFQDELFNLIPCWMASPESVSAIFPMEDTPLFDLVIFDEASQCFAEKGIPAMYRGQQVVIAGDSQQLSPHDLYRARWEDQKETDNVEEALALEAGSLLDLAAGYLMNIQLQGHYRSKTLDLIDFSNQHFYDQQLMMLPDYQDVVNDEPAIHYIKVDGVWQHNTNSAESQRVVALVEEILEKEPDKEIGIITFNAKQQEKILDDLEAWAVSQERTLPDMLFVKNIENVQGDEKDIIIFSTGYAPNEKGRLVMQFGSLNMEKGENRLNVAITRAKEKIYVVSSIHPEQMDVSKTKNEGPKLLKKYLAYALEVSQRKYTPALPVLNHHAVDWYLQHKISDWSAQQLAGFQVNRELPFADLSVREEGSKYIGLINTDDALYYQAESAKDRHAYRPFMLQKKHWKYKSVYSRQYWQNEAKIKEELTWFAKTKGEKV